MKGRWLALSFMALLLAGCLALEPLPKREEVYGKNSPVITDSFAAKEINPGETWLVYLKAKDPDGDMKNIASSVEQPGVGVYPVSFTRIKEEEGRELEGYIYLFTANVADTFNLINLTLRVQIEDKAGHVSAPVSFPLSFNTRYRQEPPPQGGFKDKDLGPIMIQLRTIGDGHVYDPD